MKTLVMEELLKRIKNRFLISIAASKRARQLKDGALPLVEDTQGQPELMVALDEIMEGKVDIEIGKPEDFEEAPKKADKKKSKDKK